MANKPLENSEPHPHLPTVAVRGDSDEAAFILRALEDAGVPLVNDGVESEPAADVAILAVDVSDRAQTARAAVEAGMHVFLPWPPAASPTEGEALLALADESGVRVGVARPMPFRPWLAARPAGWTARLVCLSVVTGPSRAALPWTHRLAGCLHLCLGMTGGEEISRIDAEAEATAPDGVEREATALCLRFRNGAYAQIILRIALPTEAESISFYASGSGVRMEASDMSATPTIITEAGSQIAPSDPATFEADALTFVRAVANRSAPPFGLEDALATLRLVEAVQERLR